MPRTAAIFFCALTALAATGTPAPEPKPWATGWDKPIDPKGDCRFEREGERLTITVPGKEHGLDGLNAPRLLRDVEGDFLVEVRVNGDCWASQEGRGFRGVGLLVMGGEKPTLITLELQGQNDAGQATQWIQADMRYPKGNNASLERQLEPASRPQQPTYLCLLRRGDMWQMMFSEDRKTWETLTSRLYIPLPQKLKVGVLAEATADGSFRAAFDKLKLFQPGR